MARILIAEPVAQPAIDALTAAHDTDVRLGLPRDDLLALLGADEGWDALVVRSQTRVDGELLAAAAPRLSVVSVASVGIDRIDVDAATPAGVMIVNAPTGKHDRRPPSTRWALLLAAPAGTYPDAKHLLSPGWTNGYPWPHYTEAVDLRWKRRLGDSSAPW